MKLSENPSPSFFFLLEDITLGSFAFVVIIILSHPLSKVDWTEPWLLGLITFHTLVTLTTVFTRHNGNIQGALFLTLLVLIYSSETLNEIAAKNWRTFSRQQYFDSNGMFISTVFSIPLLLNCIIMVGQWMWSSGNLMIQLKRKQLELSLKQENEANSKNDSNRTVNTRRRYSSTSKNQ